MTKCKECGASISDKAEACPSCGAKPPKRTSKVALVFSGLVLMFVLYVVFESANTPPPPPKTAVEIERERQQNLEFQEVVAVLRSLKASMKNPASFELVSAIKMESGALCIQYRGTNSFNAVVTNLLVVTDKTSSSSDEAWNRHCGGKTGKNFSHARLGL
jgi:uncharacterized OB-fold protein